MRTVLILVKSSNYFKAAEILKKNGYKVRYTRLDIDPMEIKVRYNNLTKLFELMQQHREIFET